MRQRVYDIGEDGGRWFVPFVLNEDSARLRVIGHLKEQLDPLWDRTSEDAYAFACEVEEALTAKATQYFFVAADRDTELVYSDARFGPLDQDKHNADVLGNPGYAIGFTMPKWSEKENK